MNNHNRVSQKSPLRYMNTKQRTSQTKKSTQYKNINHQQPNNYQQPQNHQQPNNYQQNSIQKLTETVYEMFNKHYIQFSPSYSEIYNIIETDPPVNLNSETVLRVITTVKRYYEDKIESQTPKIESLNDFEYGEIKPANSNVVTNNLKLDKTDIGPSNRYLDNNQNPIALPPPEDGFEVPSKPKDIMDTSIEKVVSYVVIDSKDRDLERFPSPNNYTIDLSPGGYTSDNERKGYIRRGFHNIFSIELISCTILDTSAEVDSSDTTNPPPYVILEIPELSRNRNMYGTNDTLSDGFDILTTYFSQGGYKYFKIPLNGGLQSIIHKYDNGINLNKLTLQFKLPNGDLYNFGETYDSATYTVNNIILKITHKEHQISTTFLHKENS
jgi:hypothetical protein